MEKSQTQEYGWVAVPRNRSNVPSNDDCKTTAATVEFETIWPQTEVVKKAEDWVKSRLPKETWNHSLRVYCYGIVSLARPPQGERPKDRLGLIFAF